MSVKWMLVFPLVLVFLGSASPGNVLVWPGEYSHWLNMKVILNELVARGHHVTVLVPSFFVAINFSELSPFQLEVISLPLSKEDTEKLFQGFIHLTTYEWHELSFWEYSVKFYDTVKEILRRHKMLFDSVVSNEKLLEKFKSAHFDILISDPISCFGELLAEKLHLPFIYSLRFSYGNTMERLCNGIPSPPSYVPASMGGLTDRMTFLQRMGNMLFYFSQDIFFHHVIFKE